jgi:hypothetical protein
MNREDVNYQLNKELIELSPEKRMAYDLSMKLRDDLSTVLVRHIGVVLAAKMPEDITNGAIFPGLISFLVSLMYDNEDDVNEGFQRAIRFAAMSTVETILKRG